MYVHWAGDAVVLSLPLTESFLLSVPRASSDWRAAFDIFLGGLSEEMVI